MSQRPAPESVPAKPASRPAIAPSPATTEFALQVAASLLQKQAEDLQILDVSGALAIVDYFVVATVKNTRQAQAIAKEVDLEAKQARGRRKRNTGGMESEDSNWVLLDFDDVVVHLFLPEARAYYGLESLFADAPRLPTPPAAPAKPAAEVAESKTTRRRLKLFPPASPLPPSADGQLPPPADGAK